MRLFTIFTWKLLTAERGRESKRVRSVPFGCLLVLIFKENEECYLIQEVISTMMSNHKLTQQNFGFPSSGNLTSYFSIFLFHLVETSCESFTICPWSVQRNMEERRQINRSFIRLSGLKRKQKALTKGENWKNTELVDDFSVFSINHGKLNLLLLRLPLSTWTSA